MIEEKYRDLADKAVNMVEGIRRTGIRILELRDRYTKVLMPMEGNGNHIGIMYAGSLFTLGEFIGGILPAVSMDLTRFFPIVKEVKIKYLRPAMTDVTLVAEFSREQADLIQKTADDNGKADFTLDLELKGNGDETVALVTGTWQVRKISEEMKGMFKTG